MTYVELAGKGGYVLRLGNRQYEVFLRAARGYGNQDIARELHCAEQTVKNQLHGVLSKIEELMGWRPLSRLDMVLVCLERGWLNFERDIAPYVRR